MAAKADNGRQPIDEHDQHWDRHGHNIRLEKYFQAVIKQDASDLHLKAGSPPHIRIKGELRPTKSDPLSGDDIEQMARELMTEKQQAYFDEHGSIDVAHELAGSDRFRINIFRQRGDVSISVRRVERKIPHFDDLHLPEILGKIALDNQGLILLAGPTGSGKSTTIASMLQHINSKRRCHIVTIEDPIEFTHVDNKALVNQREIGIDVPSFEMALKYLMREDPDVVLIGEMRDAETFQAALQASETGHLVFGTVHASSAAQTIGRILDLFSADSRSLIRQSLAFNLKAIVCQKLLPSIQEGIDRVPAVEILISNPSVRQFISEQRDQELNELIAGHEREGMITFTSSLLKLIDQELVDPRVAYEVAPNADELKMRMRGISTGQAGFTGGR
ncbi:MAG: type IV pilus twitching motility protein PilT [Phycisphaerae bacterium]